MVITHKLRPMYLTCKNVTQRVDVMQDDKYSRCLEIPLRANGDDVELPEDVRAVIRYQKPDGTGGNYDTLPDGSTAYSISGNVITVALAPQVCTVPGVVQMVVCLMQGNAEINTFVILVNVHRNPGIDAESQDYTNMRAYVKSYGWPPDKALRTDADGNVIAAEITTVDTTLTQSGQAADAATVGGRLSALSEEKANLPLAEDGTINAGISGQYATSDGAGGFNWEDGPAALPNPNALTFTGAVNGSYDGSAPLEVEIPSGGGASGDYIPIPPSAEVGQTIVVKAVDENGKPTEWEAADVPSGGGEEAWDYEKTILIEEEVASLTIDTFDDGTPLALKKVEVILVGSNATSANQGVAITPDYDSAVSGGVFWLGGGSYLTANKKHYLWGIAEINNGEVTAEFAQSNNQTQYTNYYAGISSAITKVKPGITFGGEAAEIYPRKATKFISIKAEVPAGAFAVGTILRIKGVMA